MQELLQPMQILQGFQGLTLLPSQEALLVVLNNMANWNGE